MILNFRAFPTAFAVPAVAALVVASASPAAAAATARGDCSVPAVRIDYQATVYGFRSVHSGAHVDESHEDGIMPRFSVRPANCASEILPAPLQNATTGGGAALLVAVAGLDLPPAAVDPWFAYYRDDRGWAWRHERIRTAARYIAVELDLDQSRDSPEARVCREVAVEPLRHVNKESCTIRVIVDRDDGWPIAAEVTRALTASDGSRESETVTFERLTRRP